MWNQYSKKNFNKNFTSAQQVYDCALNLLSYHDYSEKNLLERLLNKGADRQTAEEVLKKLKDYGVIDEHRYAFRVYENWLAKKCYGRAHLKAELNKRSVKAIYITEVLEEFSSEIEECQANNAADLFIKRNSKKIAANSSFDPKIYGAAVRFMAGRGFSSRYINILLKRLHADDDI